MPDTDLIRQALAHARLKIEWAKQHINGVEAIVNSVIAENTSVVNIHNDLQAGMATVTIGPKQHIPVELPLHTGDAIHAMNSAWDYLWSGLARSVDPALSSKVTAPRHKARHNLVADIRNPEGRDALIHQAFPQAEAFILDGVKPYDPASGGSVLWFIGRLDNVSKHRLLIATPYLLSFEGDLVLEGRDGGKFSQTGGTAIETQGYPLTIGLTPPVKIDNEPKATVSVVFREPDLPGTQPIVPALVQFVDAATELCELFEKTFLR